MAAMVFDALKLARSLKRAGFPSEQGEAIAEAINDAAIDTVATKSDLSEMKSDLTRWIATALVAQTATIVALTIALSKLFH